MREISEDSVTPTGKEAPINSNEFNRKRVKNKVIWYPRKIEEIGRMDEKRSPSSIWMIK